MPEALLEEIKAFADRKEVAASLVVRTACEKYLAAAKRMEAAAQEAKNGA